MSCEKYVSFVRKLSRELIDNVNSIIPKTLEFKSSKILANIIFVFYLLIDDVIAERRFNYMIYSLKW